MWRLGVIRKTPKIEMAEDRWTSDDVMDIFTTAGGSEEEWNMLFQRTDVPTWALQRIDEGEPVERFIVVTEEVLADGDLLLYQVIDDTGEPHDTALARVLEVKRTRGHTSLVVKFLAAKADDYRGWAEERFNEKRDFHLHLCRGKVKDCKGKPSSKALGWVHTDGWRLASYHSVCSLSWCREAAVDDLGHMVNRWIDFNSDGLNLRLATGEPGDVRFPWGRNVVLNMEDPHEIRNPAPSAPSRVPGDFKAAKTTGEEVARAKKLANEAALALRTGSPQVVREAPAKVEELSGEAVLRVARAKSKGPAGADKGHDRPREPSWMDEVSATGDEKDELVEVKVDEKVDKRPMVLPRVTKPKAPVGRGELAATPRGADVIPYRPKRRSTREVSSDEVRESKGADGESKRRKRRRKGSSRRRRRDSSRTRSHSEQSHSSDGSLYGRQSRKFEPLSETRPAVEDRSGRDEQVSGQASWGRCTRGWGDLAPAESGGIYKPGHDGPVSQHGGAELQRSQHLVHGLGFAP